MQDASNKLRNLDFYTKMVFIALALLVLAKIRNQVLSDPQVDSGPLHGNARTLALLSLFFWLGRITCGRLLAYVGPLGGGLNMESLNLAHAHLLLNHLPTIGFGIALCIYIGGFFSKSDSLKKAGLVLFFLVAVMAIPTYVERKRGRTCSCPELKCPPDVSPQIMRTHEDLALLAFCPDGNNRILCLAALWQLRKSSQSSQIAGWNWSVVLLLSLASFGVVALAAAEGGEIRHPEIRDAAEASLPRHRKRRFDRNREVHWVVCRRQYRSWMALARRRNGSLCRSVPAVCVVLVVDLRLLGMAKGLSFKSVYQLLPLGMLGFLLNLTTGMLFFLGAPGQYVNNVEFHRKVVLIVLAGINVLYFMLVDETWAVGPDDDAPLRTKVAAGSAIVLWIGILYYGHMLPFLGNAF